MKVAICQYDMSWEDAASNLRTVERLVERADADLVVLPEMFSTGFKLHASVVAEPMKRTYYSRHARVVPPLWQGDRGQRW